MTSRRYVVRGTRSRRGACFLIAILTACGGSASGPQPQGPLAGTYATDVSLTTTSCGPVTVQDNPTVVTHNAASGAVTFAHAGTTYAGTVNSANAFTTTPKNVNVNDGFTYVITLSGQFRSGGFDADAVVQRSSGSTTCSYTVRWVATKS